MEHNVENHIQWVSTQSLTIRVDLHSSFVCMSLPPIAKSSEILRKFVLIAV